MQPGISERAFRLLGSGTVASAAIMASVVAGIGCAVSPQGVTLAVLGIAGLILLWCMPELRVVPEKLAARTLIPFIVSILSIPAYFSIIIPGLPWISVRRIVYIVFCFAVVITICGSRRARTHISERLKSVPVFASSLIAFLAFNILSLVTSVHIGPSIADVLNTMLFGLVPFLGTILVVKNESQLRTLFFAFAACAAIDCVLGGIEFYIHHPFLIYALPASMRETLLAQAVGYSGLIEANSLRNGLPRALSIYNTALSWGEMAAMMAPIAAYFIAFGSSRGLKSTGVFFMLACTASVIFSGSRGGYLGLLIGSALFGALFVIRYVRLHPASLVGPLAVCLCAITTVTVVSSVFTIGRIHKAVLGGSETAASNYGRDQQWALAQPKIIARPLLGYGPGNATEIVGWTDEAGRPSIDSYVLTLLVSTGIPGCIAFFAMLLATITRCLYAFTSGHSSLNAFELSLGCSLTAYTLYRMNLSQAENNTFLFILLGLAVSVAALRRPQASSRAKRSDIGLRTMTAHVS